MLRRSHSRVESGEDEDEYENGDLQTIKNSPPTAATRGTNANTGRHSHHHQRQPPSTSLVLRVSPRIRKSTRARRHELEQEHQRAENEIDMDLVNVNHDNHHHDLVHNENDENDDEHLESQRYPKRSRRQRQYSIALRENNEDDNGKLRRDSFTEDNNNNNTAYENVDNGIEEDDDDEEPVGYSRRYPRRSRRPLRYSGDFRHHGQNNEEEEAEDEEEEEEEEEEDDDDDEEEEEEEPVRRVSTRERKPVNRLEYALPSPPDANRRMGRITKLSERKRRVGGGRDNNITYHDRVDSWMRRFRQEDSDCEVSDRGLGGTALGGPGVVWRPDVPLNVIESGLAGIGAGGVLGGGGAAASKQKGEEITAIQVDPSITWDMVGGLGEYIKAIKEMVFLPLVYPEVFTRFHIAPPRGLLLFGPPGTGKTLLARALAASASRAGKAVSFFMRKGADVLSKWVGESEKQLRMLFEEAQKQQPSIIFFDEIDGLAPLRNGKQDQIHNSIVSTLLALMDGLDSRGQVIVIGATNRIDAIDSALRRPGRFDREFMVPLPTVEARESILQIHTRKWTEQPSTENLKRLAEECVGYSGADLKALCTEAAIRSLRRCYPQIYEREERLLIDASTIKVEEKDFELARRGITPAAHRSAVQHARPLPVRIEPCLQSTMDGILREVMQVFPISRPCIGAYKESMAKKSRSSMSKVDVRYVTNDTNTKEKAEVGKIAIKSNVQSNENDKNNNNEERGVGAETTTTTTTPHDATFSESNDDLFEPDEALHLWAMIAEGSRIPSAASRLLITGPDGFGQQYLGSAVLHALEAFPCHPLGLPTLLADDSARSPEEALVRRITEAKRAAPAVLFLPHLQLWWEAAHNNLRVTLWMLLEDIPPDLPLFLLATADVSQDDIDPSALDLFGENVHELQSPSESDRRLFFERIRDAMVTKPSKVLKKKRVFEELPLAPLPEPKAPTEYERRLQAASEEASVRSLRMFLRDKVLLKALNDRKWSPFVKPLHLAYPGTEFSYPMDLSTMLWNLDEGKYPTLDLFRKDVRAIVFAMEEFVSYDRERVEAARVVSRARALEDTIEVLLGGCDQSMVQKCDEIAKRGGPLKLNAEKGGQQQQQEQRTFRSSRLRGDKVEKDVVSQSIIVYIYTFYHKIQRLCV